MNKDDSIVAKFVVSDLSYFRSLESAGHDSKLGYGNLIYSPLTNGKLFMEN